MSKYRKLLMFKGTTLIDEADYLLAVQFRWSISKQGYAHTSLNKGGKQRSNNREEKKRLTLHQLILRPREGLVIDHVNRNRLDNRQCNLRHATAAQNTANAKVNTRNQSGYKGVSKHKTTGMWQTYLSMKSKNKNLGYFRNAEDAARAYDKAAKDYYGDYAVLNFPEEHK